MTLSAFAKAMLLSLGISLALSQQLCAAIVHIARHGEDEDNAAGRLNGHRDEALTRRGRIQAARLNQSIAAENLKFVAIYSSPLQRAFHTAEVVALSQGLTVTKMDKLIERNFGVLQGKPYAEIRNYPPFIESNGVTYFLEVPGAESFPETYKRAEEVLAKIHEQHPGDQKVLLVAHGDIGKMLYAAALNRPWEDVLREFHFSNAMALSLGGCGSIFNDKKD